MPRKLTEERSGKRSDASPAASLLGWAKAEDAFNNRSDTRAAMTVPRRRSVRSCRTPASQVCIRVLRWAARSAHV